MNQSNMKISYFAIFWAKNHRFQANLLFFQLFQLFCNLFDKFWAENVKFKKIRIIIQGTSPIQSNKHSNIGIGYFTVFGAKNHWFQAKFHFFHFSQLFYKVFDKFWDEHEKFNENRFWGTFWGHLFGAVQRPSPTRQTPSHNFPSFYSNSKNLVSKCLIFLPGMQ